MTREEALALAEASRTREITDAEWKALGEGIESVPRFESTEDIRARRDDVPVLVFARAVMETGLKEGQVRVNVWKGCMDRYGHQIRRLVSPHLEDLASMKRCTDHISEDGGI